MDYSEQVKQKQSKVVKLQKLIQLHSDKRLPPAQAQEVQNQQYKLEFRLLELENLAFDAKIESLQKVLHIMQSVK